MQQQRTTTRRLCAGLYKVSNGERTVSVTYFSRRGDDADFNGWIAQADWSREHTDPLPSKRAAVRAAVSMIAEG